MRRLWAALVAIILGRAVGLWTGVGEWEMGSEEMRRLDVRCLLIDLLYVFGKDEIVERQRRQME